jgi:hypothetical protein
MRTSWRWSLAGLLAGALAGTLLLSASVVGAVVDDDPLPGAGEARLREVMHTPPLLVTRDEPVRLRYEIVCSLDELGTPCPLAGRVHVRPLGDARFTEVPLAQEGDAAFVASLPRRLTRTGFEYYAVVEMADGEALTLPAGGGSAPQSAKLVSGFAGVDLGTHRFGVTRRADRVVARSGWGTGPDELGLDSGPVQARIGPSAFDIAPDGSVVVLDQVNRRLAFYERGVPRARLVAIPFAGGEGDLALDRDGTVHVLDDGGAATRAPIVRAFDASGRPGSTAPLAARGADMLRIGPDGPLAHAYPSQAWLPVARRGLRLTPREQVAQARSDRPVGGDLGVVVHATPSEARFALVRGAHVVRSWRVTSATPLGEVQLAERYGSGLLVVLRVWTEDEAEFRVLELSPAGLARSFSVARAEWAESAPLSRFRLAGDSLFQLSSSPEGAEIVAFDLGGTR